MQAGGSGFQLDCPGAREANQTNFDLQRHCQWFAAADLFEPHRKNRPIRQNLAAPGLETLKMTS
jgi:hypothetical protein